MPSRSRRSLLPSANSSLARPQVWIDTVLTSILKTATDAVCTNCKLRSGNSVVEALTLMFNYVFSREMGKRHHLPIVQGRVKTGTRQLPADHVLLSCVGKLFSSIVESRLSDWSEARGVIVDHPPRGLPKRARGPGSDLLAEGDSVVAEGTWLAHAGDVCGLQESIRHSVERRKLCTIVRRRSTR